MADQAPRDLSLNPFLAALVAAPLAAITAHGVQALLGNDPNTAISGGVAGAAAVFAYIQTARRAKS